jgi:UDP-glucose 4-epimerase
MTKYLVTGGAGFIGSHIAEELLRRGDQVVVLDNLSYGKRENLEGLDVEFVEGDIRDLDVLKKVCAGAEVVFHEGAVASMPISVDDPVYTTAVNSTGTLNVFLAARDQGVRRVVYASSAAVYGEPIKTPQIETDEIKPLSPYAIHKKSNEYYGELFSHLYGLETVGLRYFNVFGPRQDPSSQYSGVISKFIELMSKGKPVTIYGDGQQTRDFVYVKDVVAANLLAADAADVSGEVFNVGTGKAVSLLDLVTDLKELLNYGLEPSFGPERPGDIKFSLSSIEKANKKLNYQPVYDLKTGLKEITIGA